MLRRSWLATGAVLALTLAGTPSATAQDDKVPEPQKALQDAVKALAKAKSFSLAIESTGGLAGTASQTVCSQPLVRRSYATEVVRPLQRVVSPESFLEYGTNRGVTRHLDSWRQLLATPEGRELPRLARTPESVLVTAARFARNHGVWLDEGEAAETWEPIVDATKGTVARADLARSNEAARPTRIRVIGPAEVATKLIVEVQNSGCLDGG